MKVTTDACLFGAWTALEMKKLAAKNCLDTGAGTGLLSLMIAQENDVLIDAVEIDADAAEQAKENVATSKLAQKITVFTQDILLWPGDKKYGCIVANPPFYENELKSARTAKNVAHHDDGLKLSALLSFINNHLAEDGCFFLLLPAKRREEFESLLQSSALYLHQLISVKQTLSHSPFRIMVCGGKTKTEGVVESNLSIKNDKNEYTPEFTKLLKDYYLYL
jgi:tRNA1Val (adenine37-N6)-methyltransferase